MTKTLCILNRICFNAYDLHSGLSEVSWALYDRETEVVHGRKHEPPKYYESIEVRHAKL